MSAWCKGFLTDLRSHAQGQPAAVKIFNVPEFNAPVSQKTFFKGDKVQFKWNQEGTSLIVLAQTDVDKSNKSYYGETTLYLLSVNGSFDARIPLDKEGPIHDVSWSSNSKDFGVVYGYMPAKTTIFNQRAVPLHNFPLGPRNTITFSPTGRFVLVAGFGNLAGSIDVYDLERDFAKVTTIESGNPSVCQWSPDGRFIMTATTSPRLRVDNGVRLYHVGGALTYVQDMTELYSVIWRPTPANAGSDPLNPVPVPHASAAQYLGTIKTPSKPAGAYRPPGARGTMTPLHFKREDEGGAAHVVSNGTPLVGPNGFGRPRRQVPGAELAEPVAVPGSSLATDAAAGNGDENLSKAALKNKKKRGNKKAKEAEARDAEYTQQAEPGLDGGGGGASLNGLAIPSGPARDRGMPAGHLGRSPERRGPQQHSRNQSRNKIHGSQSRNRSNTQRDESNHRGGAPLYQPNLQGPPGLPSRPVPAAQPVVTEPPLSEPLASPTAESPQAGANAKKIRSLQKKLRAIEDLEMRFAGGEKLEDTQVKKISTKSVVAQELELLEREQA
jgi:translation initiation factor 2A